MQPGTGRFRLDELTVEDSGLPEQVDLLGIARTLEWVASDDDVVPHTGFSDRVMVALAAEPTPRPVKAAIGAARARRPLAAIAALADLWRVAWTGGRPLAVRVPAMALVSLMLLGSLAVGALGAGATLSVLGLRAAQPSSIVSPDPSVVASPAPVASPSDDQSPEASPEPSLAPTPRPSSNEDDGSGDGAVPPTLSVQPEPGAATPGATPRPTARPAHAGDHTRTPWPTHNPRHSHSPEPTGTHHRSQSPWPSPSGTPTGGE